MRALTNLVLSLFLPITILGGTFFILMNQHVIPDSVFPIMPALPFVFAASGSAMAWQFKRSRAVFLLLLIALCCWFITLYLPGMSSTGMRLRLAYDLSALLLPINLVIFAYCEDRGVLTLWGALSAAFITAQAAAVATMLAPPQHSGAIAWLQDAALSLDRIQILPTWASNWTFLPQSVIIITGTVLFLLLLFMVLNKGRRDSMYVTLITSCLAVIAAYHYVAIPHASALFFSAAALIITLSLFQDSYFMAYVDELTDLPSRRALNADFKKLGRKYALAMVDIDHFKKFNDTYGHDIGDDVLRMVAGHLSRVSGGGKAYRYGGEEFTIIFPKGIATDVQSHLDELRERIAKTDFHIRSGKRAPKKRNARKGSVNVTISIGVAERTDGAQSPMEVVKQADRALYKAKGAGRNIVKLATAPRNSRSKEKSSRLGFKRNTRK
ncbi:GGDEF domain-containing protein [Halodesulfovibrio marinisediminis]|uniref:diguanylate cyclase n=1 Tax=Halodesulfovibrio marinisediminis DSM 17456 TaxID=1121457 RepID=A0A1N6EX59_9BACT|nr:GGDEF domain-containing protein [Halodesulfovibrio marinisediminis]SIN87541.1 diguanylate cyclase (GGDEF) domain-containing protein [Halodesulfovibrio marinisediminis DSM 17456]